MYSTGMSESLSTRVGATRVAPNRAQKLRGAYPATQCAAVRTQRWFSRTPPQKCLSFRRIETWCDGRAGAKGINGTSQKVSGTQVAGGGEREDRRGGHMRAGGEIRKRGERELVSRFFPDTGVCLSGFLSPGPCLIATPHSSPSSSFLWMQAICVRREALAGHPLLGFCFPPISPDPVNWFV